ncbi:DUF2207 family protein [Nonomuraea typhae]|uniref:DUF2207 family protein n=1 Tax=Nonomuraea typhae TaxID=2603600 RepID=UPI0015E1D426|nr:DUF2207 domain-containing protein [Nonomuraea typhae]
MIGQDELAALTPPVAIAAAAFALLWLLQLVARIRAAKGPRVGRAAAAPEFEGLSPAVVDLITENGTLTHEAAAATVLDLAARGHAGIEEVGPGLCLVRLRRARDRGGLKPYELMVLDHLTALGGTGVVATEAIAEGSRELGRWRDGFEKSVIEEARALGLTRKAGGPGTGMSITGLIAALLLGVLADLTLMPGAVGTLTPHILLTGLVVTTAFDKRLAGERLTRRGRAAAAHWLGVRTHLRGIAHVDGLPSAAVTIWGRQLAYAAAFGLTRAALASLPVLRPRDEERAWSDHGGLWHRVRITYPGQNKVITGLLLFLIFGIWVGSALGVSIWYGLRPLGPDDPQPFMVSMIMTVGGGLVTLAFMIIVVLPIGLIYRAVWKSRAAAARPRRTLEGRVIRLHAADITGKLYYLAIDHGPRRVRAIRALGSQLTGVADGDVVRARVTRAGYLASIDVLERRPRPDVRYHDT